MREGARNCVPQSIIHRRDKHAKAMAPLPFFMPEGLRCIIRLRLWPRHGIDRHSGKDKRENGGNNRAARRRVLQRNFRRPDPGDARGRATQRPRSLAMHSRIARIALCLLAVAAVAQGAGLRGCPLQDRDLPGQRRATHRLFVLGRRRERPAARRARGARVVGIERICPVQGPNAGQARVCGLRHGHVRRQQGHPARP